MTRPREKTIDLIKRLVAFDTVSRKSNLALIDFVRDYLDGLGIESRLTHDDSGVKANLFATIGPQDRPGIVLSGHTDVVPVEDQPWTADPFAAVERDGKLFGRGTADMKSFIAVALSLAPEFANARLSAAVHFAFSFDEEVGCVGVPRLIADLKRMGLRPKGCIVGEPTEMKVVSGHKGKRSMHCDVRGAACHSALAPYGVNAVEIAAEIVTYLRRMGRRFREQGPHDSAFDPPFSTVHTGIMRGGTAINVVPGACSFDFEFRTLPGHDPVALLGEVKAFAERDLIPEMHAVAKDSGIAWSEASGFPGLDTPEDADIAALAKALAGANATGKVSFGTEAGLFQQDGIPAIVCGPGSIQQAHKPDEFITLDQVARCESFLLRLKERLAAA
ncbi:MAG: acetylornithine deacetylase [Alphaproteobacteria bacterium]